MDKQEIEAAVGRIGDLLSEIHDALHRFNIAAEKLEELTAKAEHTAVVGKLTDERFRTVTRG